MLIDGHDRRTTGHAPLGKVPAVTISFWLVEVLATTVGETAADWLSDTVGLGLAGTTGVMSVLLLVALLAQFRTRRYVPGVYWLAVVLTSVVGTLITDNVTGRLGVGFAATAMALALLLALTFAVWYRVEHTLSIQRIDTTRREAFYWTVVLFTFALGTAVGDWLAEGLDLGYLTSLVVSAAAIGAVAIADFGLGLDPVIAFWIAYTLTRPLGASIGDLLSQPTADGGLGLGTTATTALCLGAIVVMVVGLGVQERRHRTARWIEIPAGDAR